MTQILPERFFAHGPQTSKSKENASDVVVCAYACYQSPWASVCLLQSYSPYRRQPCLKQSHCLQLIFLRLWPLKASYIQLQGAYWGPHCPVTLSWKPKALSTLIVRELTASLQKGLNACSLIIWILVNWINCWIETVLLKNDKNTRAEGAGGLISFLRSLRLSETHVQAHMHTPSLGELYCHDYRPHFLNLFLFHARISTGTERLYATQV